MLFTIERLLSGPDLERAMRIVTEARYIDGSATAAYGSDIKNNREMEIGESYLELIAIVNRAIEASDAIEYRVLPRYRTNPLVNRFDPGMYYREHVDAPIQGGQTQLGRTPGKFGQNFIRTDYSMTLFLSPPETYDGGELELNLFEQSRRIKLAAGSAVCYVTGIPHQVLPVTRGTRIAAICWFQTQVTDVNLRRVIWDQYCLEQRLAEAGDNENAARAKTVLENLIRYTAEI